MTTEKEFRRRRISDLSAEDRNAVEHSIKKLRAMLRGCDFNAGRYLEDQVYDLCNLTQDMDGVVEFISETRSLLEEKHNKVIQPK